MVEALQSPSDGSTLAADITPASLVVPPSQPEHGNSRLEAILVKKSKGLPLTRAEAGYLGGVRRKAKPALAPATNQNPLLGLPLNPENPLFAAETSPVATAQAQVAPVVDSRLLQSAANALLTSLDTATKLYVGYEAKQSGADAATVADYESAVALQPSNRNLMVENSEPLVLKLCELFKCSPEKLESTLKNSGFVGGLLAHGLGVFAAVKSIRESRKERETLKAKPA